MTDEGALAALRSVLPAHYQLHGYLDEGGQGAVFRGCLNGEDIAIKVFVPERDPGFRRLDREIPLLQAIDCPNLVRLRDHMDITLQGITTRLVAYEYYSGGDLRQFLTPDCDPISTETLAQIGAQMGNAVRELWSHRIVHRDIKPANVVMANRDRFVLVDVGFARHIDRSNLTALGQAPGTHGYKSPEQALGRRSLTINSDVFSLGITLYEIASKTHPFHRTQERIGRRNFSPQPLRDLRVDLPEPLTRLIHQMMATKPADRPQNVFERFSLLIGRL